jgi:hypothetical protein
MKYKPCGRKRSWHSLRNYPDIFLEGLKKATETLSEDSKCPGRVSSRGAPSTIRSFTTWANLPGTIILINLTSRVANVSKLDPVTPLTSYSQTSTYSDNISEATTNESFIVGKVYRTSSPVLRHLAI